jgi:hypothetical protein
MSRTPTYHLSTAQKLTLRHSLSWKWNSRIERSVKPVSKLIWSINVQQAGLTDCHTKLCSAVGLNFTLFPCSTRPSCWARSRPSAKSGRTLFVSNFMCVSSAVHRFRMWDNVSAAACPCSEQH